MSMFSKTTNGIKINVETSFLPEKSNPDHSYYVYAYYVTIKNTTEDTVQLLSRHWIITDGMGNKHEVKGEGVIGEQPILIKDAHHAYQSWSPLPTKMGKMEGSYMMINLKTNEKFEVQIPAFVLVHHELEN